MNHNEYAVPCRAVSRMKMPQVREYASSLLIGHKPQISVFIHSAYGSQSEMTTGQSCSYEFKRKLRRC